MKNDNGKERASVVISLHQSCDLMLLSTDLVKLT